MLNNFLVVDLNDHKGISCCSLARVYVKDGYDPSTLISFVRGMTPIFSQMPLSYWAGLEAKESQDGQHMRLVKHTPVDQYICPQEKPNETEPPYPLPPTQHLKFTEWRIAMPKSSWNMGIPVSDKPDPPLDFSAFGTVVEDGKKVAGQTWLNDPIETLSSEKLEFDGNCPLF